MPPVIKFEPRSNEIEVNSASELLNPDGIPVDVFVSVIPRSYPSGFKKKSAVALNPSGPSKVNANDIVGRHNTAHNKIEKIAIFLFFKITTSFFTERILNKISA
jgi:hypothetical protein